MDLFRVGAYHGGTKASLNRNSPDWGIQPICFYPWRITLQSLCVIADAQTRHPFMKRAHVELLCFKVDQEK